MLEAWHIAVHLYNLNEYPASVEDALTRGLLLEALLFTWQMLVSSSLSSTSKNKSPI